MTAAKPLRINARISPEVARKAEYLEKRLHLSTTDMVRQAIEHYYEAVRARQGTVDEILASAGFIGCAEGPADLSETYKAELAPSLERKTRSR